MPMMARLALGLALGLGLVSLYVTMQARGNPQAASATAGARRFFARAADRPVTEGILERPAAGLLLPSVSV
jgi:hypothetical protein